MSTLQLCAAAVDNPAAGEAPTAAVQGCRSARSKAQTNTNQTDSVFMQPYQGHYPYHFAIINGDGGCDGIIRSVTGFAERPPMVDPPRSQLTLQPRQCVEAVLGSSRWPML
jgi:hypothetical protein